MITIVLIFALVLALAGTFMAYRGVQRAEAKLELIESVLAAHDEALDEQQALIDELMSDGQVEEAPRPKKLPEVGNLRELNDYLPLQGHTLIVGQSGSGKSNLLMSTILRKLKDGQQLHVIDTKQEIEPIFGRVLTCVGTDKAEDKFKELLTLAQERRELFNHEAANFGEPIRDYSEYYAVTGEKLPIVNLIVEEMTVTAYDIDQEDLVKLTLLGRSSGVFVTILSQYIKDEIVPKKASTNFTCRVFLGRWDTSADTLFGPVDKNEKPRLVEFVGSPGKAVVQEGGQFKCVTMPRVSKDFLVPFMRKEQ